MLVSAAFVVACDGVVERDAATDTRTRRPPAAATEAARVNGVVIAVAEVAAAASLLNLDPKAALERLVAEQLLVAEAKRRQLGALDDVERVGRQAAVQLLLKHDVEGVTVTDEAVAAAYESQRTRFVVPERRASLHVLVSIKRDEPQERQRLARSVAQGVLAELRAAGDAKQAWERYQGGAELDGFAIKAEEIPLAAQTDPYAPEYLTGLFSLSVPGLVPELVRTDFGWHAIIVTAVQPAEITTLEQARLPLRGELSVKLREKSLEQLVAALERRHRVERDEATVDALLHADADALGTAAP